LENNEWIYFVPTSESITILCPDKAPIDVMISGIGKLGIHENCKGFGTCRYNSIKTEKPILCIDNLRQYYYFRSYQELQMCKEPTRQKYVCKQSKPLLSSLMQDECAVRLLKEWTSLPNSCEMHYVQLANTVWTQISDNEWVHYVLSKDSIT
jgi:hypothetical protein